MEIDNKLEQIIRKQIKEEKIKLNSQYIVTILNKEHYSKDDIRMLFHEMIDEGLDISSILFEIEEKDKINNIKLINLPENMTIGIELESEGDYGKLIYRMSDIIEKGWECKR